RGTGATNRHRPVAWRRRSPPPRGLSRFSEAHESRGFRSRVAGGDTIREPLVNFRFEPAVPRAANRHPFWECARFLQPPEMHGAVGNAACAEIAITEQGHGRPRIAA